MGVAAYQRGNAVISRQIEADLRARPDADEGFARDYGMRSYLRRLEGRLARAVNRFRLVCAEKDVERRRAAAVLRAVERTWDEARAAGLTADDRGMYWLALARHRAHRADPGAPIDHYETEGR